MCLYLVLLKSGREINLVLYSFVEHHVSLIKKQLNFNGILKNGSRLFNRKKLYRGLLKKRKKKNLVSSIQFNK